MHGATASATTAGGAHVAFALALSGVVEGLVDGAVVNRHVRLF
jgi:hypothetical protein